MATNIPITPPEKFDFKKPDEWLKWKRRFEQFLSASGPDKEDESRRVSTLLYCLGNEAHNVLTSMGVSAEDKKVYAKVLEKFDRYFDVRKNVIFERARFNKRKLNGEMARVHHRAVQFDRDLRIRRSKRRDAKRSTHNGHSGHQRLP